MARHIILFAAYASYVHEHRHGFSRHTSRDLIFLDHSIHCQTGDFRVSLVETTPGGKYIHGGWNNSADGIK